MRTVFAIFTLFAIGCGGSHSASQASSQTTTDTGALDLSGTWSGTSKDDGYATTEARVAEVTHGDVGLWTIANVPQPPRSTATESCNVYNISGTTFSGWCIGFTTIGRFNCPYNGPFNGTITVGSSLVMRYTFSFDMTYCWTGLIPPPPSMTRTGEVTLTKTVP